MGREVDRLGILGRVQKRLRVSGVGRHSATRARMYSVCNARFRNRFASMNTSTCHALRGGVGGTVSLPPTSATLLLTQRQLEEFNVAPSTETRRDSSKTETVASLHCSYVDDKYFSP